MFIVTLCTYLLRCYVIRDFKVPEVKNFDLQYLKMEKSSIEEKMLTIM